MRKRLKKKLRIFQSSQYFTMTRTGVVLPLKLWAPGPELRMLNRYEKKWALSFKLKNRVVAQDQLTPDLLVSTVFLGLNHNHFCKGPPLLFETMIFGGKLADSMWRYTTRKKALKGHRVAVRLALAGQCAKGSE